MSFEPLNVYVQKYDHQPVEGVVVKVFNQAGTVVFDQQVSDSAGLAAFLLESGFTYQLRFYKQQFTIKNPFYVTILEAPSTNDINIYGQVITPPAATDPRLCRLSGYFRRPNGGPAPNVDIHFIARFDPILLEGAAMIVERVTTRTDKNGYTEVDLVRLAKYDVTIQGFEDIVRVIAVPDLPSANAPDVIFPVVSSVTFDPPGPYALASGQEIVVTPRVVASSGLVLEGTAMEDVSWSSSDGDILALSVTQTTLTLRGVDPGAAELKLERSDKTIIRIPEPGIVGSPVAVTVT